MKKKSLHNKRQSGNHRRGNSRSGSIYHSGSANSRSNRPAAEGHIQSQFYPNSNFNAPTRDPAILLEVREPHNPALCTLPPLRHVLHEYLGNTPAIEQNRSPEQSSSRLPPTIPSLNEMLSRAGYTAPKGYQIISPRLSQDPAVTVPSAPPQWTVAPVQFTRDSSVTTETTTNGPPTPTFSPPNAPQQNGRPIIGEDRALDVYCSHCGKFTACRTVPTGRSTAYCIFCGAIWLLVDEDRRTGLTAQSRSLAEAHETH
ncbi:hypothetical protein F5Y12DRAFT_712949 [Xylaria sp. FL1777]|nr:hypothetical protein F5Y12DRAFT_712949 [Xylaria sp. FL1777]